MSAYLRPLRCYVSPTGRNKIEQWYKSLSMAEQADADVFIKRMRKVHDWVYPQYKYLFWGNWGTPLVVLSQRAPAAGLLFG